MSPLFESHNRLRGRMPFREVLALRKHLTIQRRTGEPSPSNSWAKEVLKHWEASDKIRGIETIETSYGYKERRNTKGAKGSYTEKLRKELFQFLEDKYGSRFNQVNFQYRLHRHRVINVVGVIEFLKHDPAWGKGKKGFILEVKVIAIDGKEPANSCGEHMSFAWDRIIGKGKVFLLPPRR